MKDKKYTLNQAIKIANLAVELGQEREHIKRFGYASRSAKYMICSMGDYIDVFEPVLKKIPIEERGKLPIKMIRDFSKLVQSTQKRKESSDEC